MSRKGGSGLGEACRRRTPRLGEEVLLAALRWQIRYRVEEGLH